MKTLEELYKEVMASDELKKEFAEAAKTKDGIDAWLKKHECSATFDELCAFLKEKSDGEMKDDDVDAVAGGKTTAGNIATDVLCSVITFTIACDYVAIQSEKKYDSAKQCFKEGWQ